MKNRLNHLFSSVFFKDSEILKSNFKKYFSEVGFFNENQKKNLENFLQIKIRNFAFFEQALTHRSYLQTTDKKIYSNERLEFLGDAILGMVTAEYLFYEYDLLEGELTKMRASYVNKKSLAYCAKKMSLQDFILMTFSAEKSIKSGSESILSDCMEAIIAAIYLDSGISKAGKFIIKTMIPIIENKEFDKDENYKSILLESLQAQGKVAPTYKVIGEKGPDHDKQFISGVYCNEELLEVGEGKSKKLAEQDAAKKALFKLKIIE